MQMVFQDPHASLNPAMTIETAVGHPLQIHRIARGRDDIRRRVSAALERVGLTPPEQYLGKYPSDLSGGQKQRAVLARAVILEPTLLIADEPVSMLDMSVRAKILELMLALRNDLDLTYLYITHDLATAKFFCDRVAIMYLGRIVELGPTSEIFANPRHPYTVSLLKAIPDPDPSRGVPRDLPRGEVPDAASPPLGCRFHPRCPRAFDVCGWEARDLRDLLERRWAQAGEERFEAERRIVGDLSQLDEPQTDMTMRPGGGHTAPEFAEMLAAIRAEQPDEPFWRGVRSMEPAGSQVRVSFHEPLDPALRRDGPVDVACHLYDPVALRRAGRETAAEGVATAPGAPPSGA
jgi:peptide/nickel transport system ATP-binding protein